MVEIGVVTIENVPRMGTIFSSAALIVLPNRMICLGHDVYWSSVVVYDDCFDVDIIGGSAKITAVALTDLDTTKLPGISEEKTAIATAPSIPLKREVISTASPGI